MYIIQGRINGKVNDGITFMSQKPSNYGSATFWIAEITTPAEHLDRKNLYFESLCSLRELFINVPPWYVIIVSQPE